MCERRLQQSSEPSERALHEAGELREQFLAGREIGEAVGRGGIHDGAVEITAADHEIRVVLRELLEGLGRPDRIVGAEHEAGGTLEQVVEALDAGVGDSALRERVLDHTQLGVGRPQLGAQLGHVLDAEPAVVGQERRDTAGQTLADLRDLCDLVLTSHVGLLVLCGRPRRGASLGARAGGGSTAPGCRMPSPAQDAPCAVPDGDGGSEPSARVRASGGLRWGGRAEVRAHDQHATRTGCAAYQASAVIRTGAEGSIGTPGLVDVETPAERR